MYNGISQSLDPLDYRNFAKTSIQEWVNSHWEPCEEIMVHKSCKIFVFVCQNAVDKEFLINQHNANYQGALITFKEW